MEGLLPMPDEWTSLSEGGHHPWHLCYKRIFDGATKVANFEAELDAWVQHT